MRLEPVIVGLLIAFASTAATNPSPVTFTKDVAPVLEKNCQGCHRPGEAAPFSLLTYEQARPWAKAMKEAVLLKKMPPWFADSHYGKFSNDRSLSQKEIDTLVAWSDAGAPQGDPKDMPPPANFVEGWRIPKPDVVFEMPNTFEVPATGTVEYQYIVVPSGFTEDKWVRFSEARPGNRQLVHHIIAFIREPGSKWLKDAQPGVPFVPKKNKDGEKDEGGRAGDFLAGYAPGTMPVELAPGQAKLVKAKSDIVFQMHYTANGHAGTDRSKVGVVFATEPPKERVFTLAAGKGDFKIPPGDPNYKVDSEFEMGTQVKLISLLPHMHLRGKDFEYRVVYPTGETETILSVPRYSFSWQLSYYPVKPIVLTKGTKIECTAHYDNSPNNPSNPDATKEVAWGDQSWDEMMIGFFDVAFDAKMPLKNLFPEKKDEKKAGGD
jgi:hypothetical protein